MYHDYWQPPMSSPRRVVTQGETAVASGELSSPRTPRGRELAGEPPLPHTPGAGCDSRASMSSSPGSSRMVASPPSHPRPPRPPLGGAEPPASAAFASPGGEIWRARQTYPPRGPSGLSEAAHVAIVEAFVNEVPRLFGANLVYAIVVGSVARGHAIAGDDIDTFVVVEVQRDDQLDAFQQWLERLHERVGLEVDHAFPYEVVTRRELDERVWPRLASTHLDLDFNGREVFDTITWADMVAGDHVGAVGSRTRLAEDAARARPHVARWRDELLRELAARGALADLARCYVASDTYERDVPGGSRVPEAVDWRALAGLSLSRLVRRVVPVADTSPPEGTSRVAEALMGQPVLHTPSLVLRPLAADDARAIFDMCRRPEVAEHCSWEPMDDDAQAAAYIRGQLAAAQAGQATNWAVWHRAQRRVIGTCGLVDLDEANSHATLGFALHPEFQRQGLASEAARRVITFLEGLDITKISAEVVQGHHASQKVLLDLGMEYEATLKKHVYKNGTFHDLVRHTRLSERRRGL